MDRVDEVFGEGSTKFSADLCQHLFTLWLGGFEEGAETPQPQMVL